MLLTTQAFEGFNTPFKTFSFKMSVSVRNRPYFEGNKVFDREDDYLPPLYPLQQLTSTGNSAGSLSFFLILLIY